MFNATKTLVQGVSSHLTSYMCVYFSMSDDRLSAGVRAGVLLPCPLCQKVPDTLAKTALWALQGRQKKV